MKIIILLLVVLAGWQIHGKYSTPVITNADLELLNTSSETDSASSFTEELTNKVSDFFAPSSPTFETSTTTLETHYSCDGRQHCSQMSSCEEATFFIKNCPNTKMDGDHDGIPCERQFCN